MNHDAFEKTVTHLEFADLSSTTFESKGLTLLRRCLAAIATDPTIDMIAQRVGSGTVMHGTIKDSCPGAICADSFTKALTALVSSAKAKGK